MLLGLKTQQHKIFTSYACENLAMARGEPRAPGKGYVKEKLILYTKAYFISLTKFFFAKIKL
jgi:hypothetical protein